MSRRLAPRTLAIGFLAASAALSTVLLAVRNLYDDEIFSLGLIRSPVADILRGSAEGDVHPPGMYLLAHWSYRLVPSYRWMNLFAALVLYAGLTVFLLKIVPLFDAVRPRICLLLLATLHPQLLMWGNSFRWYSWWTGLALLTLIVALQPSRAPARFSTRRALALSLLFACLFYLNYITLLLLAALAPAVVLRYRDSGQRSLLRSRALLSGIVFLALIAPQLHTLWTVHLPNGRSQRYSAVVSSLRLVQSVAPSEAYLPWHPLAVLAGVLFLALLLRGGWALRRGGPQLVRSPLAPLALCALLFFVLVALTGLGGKPRNGLLLVPLYAVCAARVAGTLRLRLQTVLLLLLAVWSGVGIAHLLTRSSLTKSMLMDRPEQVVRFIAQGDPADTCAVIVTYNSSLAFALAQSHLPNLLIVSPFRGPIFGGERTLHAAACDHPRLYIVRSYLGGTAGRAASVSSELTVAASYLTGAVRQDAFSPDPDAALKRRLAALSPELTSAERLPDFRYLVTSGVIDRPDIQPMRRQMPAFVSGFQTSVLEPSGSTGR